MGNADQVRVANFKQAAEARLKDLAPENHANAFVELPTADYRWLIDNALPSDAAGEAMHFELDRGCKGAGNATSVFIPASNLLWLANNHVAAGGGHAE